MRKILLLLLALSLLFSACSAPGGGQIAAAKVQRQSAPSVDSSLLLQQVAGNNAFAFDLYQALRTREGNLFYSPYSLSVALAMAYAGARGETEKQMASTLHNALPQDQLHPALNALDQQLNAQNSGTFRLSVANSLWGQNGFPFRDDFLNTIGLNYGAGVRLADFTSDGSRESARKAINGWVSRETQEKIKDLLSRDALTNMTRLVLVNAIYFKGEWQHPFDGHTADAPFTLLDGKQVTVPMMSRREGTPYYKGDGFQAVALPYKDSRAEMIIVLPDEGKFAQFEQSFGRDQMSAVLAGLEDRDIKLYLPRFHFDFSVDLNDTLKQMGMPDAFDPGAADFSGIYDKTREPRNLYISHVAHKAYVAVDEKGTEAAAASGIVMEIVSMPVEVRADRPFLFFIIDRASMSYLFMGRLVNPR